MNSPRKIPHKAEIPPKTPQPLTGTKPSKTGEMAGKSVKDLTTPLRLDKALKDATLKDGEKVKTGLFKNWGKDTVRDRIKEGEAELRQLAKEAGVNLKDHKSRLAKGLKQETELIPDQETGLTPDQIEALKAKFTEKSKEQVETREKILTIKTKLESGPEHLRLNKEERYRLDFLYNNALPLGTGKEFKDFEIDQSIYEKLDALAALELDLIEPLKTTQTTSIATQVSRLTETELQAKFDIDKMPKGLSLEKQKQYAQNLHDVLLQTSKPYAKELLDKCQVKLDELATFKLDLTNPLQDTQITSMARQASALTREEFQTKFDIDNMPEGLSRTQQRQYILNLQAVLSKVTPTSAKSSIGIAEFMQSLRLEEYQDKLKELDLTKPLQPTQITSMARQASALIREEFHTDFDIDNMPAGLNRAQQKQYILNLQAILLEVTPTSAESSIGIAEFMKSLLLEEYQNKLRELK